MTCPKCGSERVFSSRYKSLAEFFDLLFQFKRPFRCHNCWVRYGDAIWQRSRGYRPRKSLQ